LTARHRRRLVAVRWRQRGGSGGVLAGEGGGLLAGEEGAKFFNGAHQRGGEHGGGVLVDADLGQALQVAQLQRERVSHHDVGGIPERGGGQGLSSALMILARFSRSASAWRAMARFVRGLRDLVDRVADVLDRHDRFNRVDHPEAGDAGTQMRDCQEDRVCEAVIREGWGGCPGSLDLHVAPGR
jgi:hypothetical protein